MVWLSWQAEVQQVYGDGTLSLHTRSLKYGKVSLLCLNPVYVSLVPRPPRVKNSLGTRLCVHMHPLLVFLAMPLSPLSIQSLFRAMSLWVRCRIFALLFYYFFTSENLLISRKLAINWPMDTIYCLAENRPWLERVVIQWFCNLAFNFVCLISFNCCNI